MLLPAYLPMSSDKNQEACQNIHDLVEGLFSAGAPMHDNRVVLSQELRGNAPGRLNQWSDRPCVVVLTPATSGGPMRPCDATLSWRQPRILAHFTSRFPSSAPAAARRAAQRRRDHQAKVADLTRSREKNIQLYQIGARKVRSAQPSLVHVVQPRALVGQSAEKAPQMPAPLQPEWRVRFVHGNRHQNWLGPPRLPQCSPPRLHPDVAEIP
jgi:hypothetical protein